MSAKLLSAGIKKSVVDFMKVSLEYLYHYICDHCQKWWTIADIKPDIGSHALCPHCGKTSLIEEIVQFQIKT